MPARDVSSETLEAVLVLLKKYGRPRKNPGGKRPVAVLNNGKTVEKVTSGQIQEIKKISLPGAFRYVEITGMTNKISSEKAKQTFYEAHAGKNGFPTGTSESLDAEIARIDQETYDVRLLKRSLRAAQKQLHREASKNAAT